MIEVGENLGPAGGFALGFETVLARGAEKVWAVDDDCEAESHCLERLLGASAPVAVPKQIKPSGEARFPPSWNGPLFDSEVMRTVGLPRTDFFFWAEDSEFFGRARAADFAVVNVADAVVFNHDAGGRRRGEARNWRIYYEVRNTLEWRLRLRPKTRHNIWRAARVVIGKAAAIVVFEPHKLRSLHLWWAGVRDFRRRRFGRLVEPD